MNWIHKLFNPHCEHCREESINETVEFLKLEVHQYRIENQRLLNIILSQHTTIATDPPVDDKELKPISSMHVPWRVKREQLERAERIEADKLKKENTIEKLEKELDINAG